MAGNSVPRQLLLAGDPMAAGAIEEEREFVRGLAVDRSGYARYVHIIRALGDPQRSPRPVGGRKDRAPHRTLAKTTVDVCERDILGVLADGLPRTFNRIGIELLDHTADTLMGSPYEDALWRLVARGELEHTIDAPVLFRLPVGAG